MSGSLMILGCFVLGVLLAKVLAQQTPIIFLDEPTTGLDMVYQEEIFRFAKALAAQGKTVLMVVHELNLASKYCSRILLLGEGTILADGAPEEVFTEELLSRMDQLEQSGTSFPDVKATDIRVRYVAPVIVTVILVGLMFALGALLLWGMKVAPEDAPPFWFIATLMLFLAAVGIGAVLALTQRIREIQKGEIDDAKKY